MRKKKYYRTFQGKRYHRGGSDYYNKADAKMAKNYRKALGQKFRIIKRGRVYELWVRAGKGEK